MVSGLHLHPYNLTSLTFIFLLISILSVFMFLCASHRKPQKLTKHSVSIPHSSEKKFVSRLNSSISSKALLMVKMRSWKKTAMRLFGGRRSYEENSSIYPPGNQSGSVWWDQIV
ncbi:hypothetical protein ACJRO7_027261 [Eucalyptus globulus]|uniref:Transmembrane protein n=1 Tax=Eucalyptus globulus TaxID=34317 RepID=A0ABD3JQR5_EUCGL